MILLSSTKLRQSEISVPDPFPIYEMASKLALAFHMGRRTSEDARVFTAKLAATMAGDFQLSTDGFNTYPAAVEEHLGWRVDYGQIVKVFGPETVDSERRYSPPAIISGAPGEERICTSPVERTNLHIRMQMCRFTRLTNAFSRKRDNLRAALALHLATYNFTWTHSSIRMTPDMKAGLTRKPWTMRDLPCA